MWRFNKDRQSLVIDPFEVSHPWSHLHDLRFGLGVTTLRSRSRMSSKRVEVLISLALILSSSSVSHPQIFTALVFLFLINGSSCYLSFTLVFVLLLMMMIDTLKPMTPTISLPVPNPCILWYEHHTLITHVGWVDGFPSVLCKHMYPFF